MSEPRSTTVLLLALLMGVLASCASSEKSDGLEEEVSSNSSKKDELDLENLDLPGEKTAGATSKPDPEVLNPDVDPGVLLAPSDSSIAKAAKEMAVADAEHEKALGEEGFGDLKEQSEEKIAQAPRGRRSGGGGYRVPKIPGSALQKKGTLLNRFYFARQGDSPDSVSMLVYGNSDRAKDLTKWNGNAWKAGKLLYYNSPVQGTDTEMRSFYQERNVPPEEYSVQAGDTLLKVAKAKYANEGSWKEIAVINGFEKMGKTEPGTRIALYPTDLKPFAAAATSSNGLRRNAVPPPEPEVAEKKPAEVPTEKANAAAAAPNTPPTTESVPAVAPSKSKKSGPKLNPIALIEQNLFAVVLGGGVFILLILLMILSKQRKKKALGGLDEFNEELGAAPKSRRK